LSGAAAGRNRRRGGQGAGTALDAPRDSTIGCKKEQ